MNGVNDDNLSEKLLRAFFLGLTTGRGGGIRKRTTSRRPRWHSVGAPFSDVAVSTFAQHRESFVGDNSVGSQSRWGCSPNGRLHCHLEHLGCAPGRRARTVACRNTSTSQGSRSLSGLLLAARNIKGTARRFFEKGSIFQGKRSTGVDHDDSRSKGEDAMALWKSRSEAGAGSVTSLFLRLYH